MKTMKKVLFVLLVVLMLFAGCDIAIDESNGDNKNGNSSVSVTLNSVSADGSSAWTTTQLVLAFDKAIPGLTAADITLSGVSGVSKGTISGSNPYVLPISGFTSGGTLSVAVAKSGYTISGSPKTANIYYSSGSNNNNNTTAAFNDVSADGSLTVTTTQLVLAFDKAISGLSADDITLSGVDGISKGTLSGSNPYILPISGFTSGGTLNVAVAKSGCTISGSPNTVNIYYSSGNNNNNNNITFNSIAADGSSTQTTTQLTLTFDSPINGLSAADITLSSMSGISKGTLSGSNPYTLPISGFTSGGTLSVAVAKSGYTISGSPKSVDIYYSSGNNNNNNTTAILNNVIADGSSTQTTTQLTLIFDREIPGLTATDITLNGVYGISKGMLSGSNPYTLPVGGFTSSGNLSVSVSKSGYDISNSPKTVSIYYCIPVTLNNVTANGSSSQNTTQLTLTFDSPINWLSADDITLSGVNGVSKGTLSGSNPYTLPVSGFTSGGTLNVTVAKSGYYINGSSKTVGIYYSSGNGNSSVLKYLGYIDSPNYKEYKLTITGNNSFELEVSTKISSGTAAQNGSQFLWTLSPQAGAPFTVQLSTSGIVQIAGVITFNNGSYETGPGLITPGIGGEMIQIPGGSFEKWWNEIYIETITMSSFYMCKYEVTQEQWTAVMGSNPSYFYDSPASWEVQNKRPVECVNWYDALVFCNKLSMLNGLRPAYRINGSTNPADWGTVPFNDWNWNNGNPIENVIGNTELWNAVEIVTGSNGYRLPTGEQWEYAARGGNGSPGDYTYSGSDNVDSVGWYKDNSGDKTHEVGKKAPNDLGLYDMSGNVEEWCWDVKYISEEAWVRVCGGSYYDDSWDLCSTNHQSYTKPYSRVRSIGFRLVRPSN